MSSQNNRNFSRLNRRRKSDKRSPAASPGTLVHLGDRRVTETCFRVIQYSSEFHHVYDDFDLPRLIELNKAPKANTHTLWVQVIGLADIQLISELLELYKIHLLIQEDVLNTNHRPKIDYFDDYCFVSLKEFIPKIDQSELWQLSIINLGDTLISFHEAQSGLTEPIENRLSNKAGQLRNRSASYLTWAVVDAVIDHYVSAVELFGIEVEEMEKEIVESKRSLRPELNFELYNIKADVDHFVQAVRPTQEIAASLHRLDQNQNAAQHNLYWSDLCDHIHYVIDSVEELREKILALRDYYLAVSNLKMNEVVKLLTVFASVFLPLTFLVGIYGMNFKHMPELEGKWGYPVMWGLFILLPATMLYYFRRRDWI